MKTFIKTLLVCLAFFCFPLRVYSQDLSWKCLNCGNEATGNFCNNCGSARPEEEMTSEKLTENLDDSSQIVGLVLADNIGVYADPNKIQEDPLMTLSKGDFVEVLQVFDELISGGKWCYIRKDGTQGYVYQRAIDISDATQKKYEDAFEEVKQVSEAETPKQELVSNTKYELQRNIDIYKDTNSGRIILSIEKGQIIEITGEDGEWFIINYNGKKGYAKKKFVECTEPIENTMSSGQMIELQKDINVREATNSIKVAFKATKGENIEIIDEIDEFYQVRYNDKVGYVKKNLLDNVQPIASNEDSDEQQTEETTQTERVPGQVIELKRGISAYKEKDYSTLIFGVAKGQNVDVISDDGEWCLISYNGREGYVKKKLLENDDKVGEASIQYELNGDHITTVVSATGRIQDRIAGSNYTVLLFLNRGDEVEVLKIIEEPSFGTKWCLVRKDGIEGYITQSSLDLSGTLALEEYNAELGTYSEDESSMSEEVDVGATYEDADTVRAVQEALNAAGFDCGPVDGVAGNMTKAAITAYEESNGLVINGIITDQLIKALGIDRNKAPETERQDNTSQDVSDVRYLCRHLENIISWAETTDSGKLFTFYGPIKQDSAVAYKATCIAGEFVIMLNEVSYNDTRVGIVVTKLSSDSDYASTAIVSITTAILSGIDWGLTEDSAMKYAIELFNKGDRTLSVDGITITASADAGGIYFTY